MSNVKEADFDPYSYCPICGDEWDAHQGFRCWWKLTKRQPFCFRKNIGYLFEIVFKF